MRSSWTWWDHPRLKPSHSRALRGGVVLITVPLLVIAFVLRHPTSHPTTPIPVARAAVSDNHIIPHPNEPISRLSYLSLSPPDASHVDTSLGHTLFLVAGVENRCVWQYNYVCRFFFYVRCYIFGAFRNFSLVSDVQDAIHHALPGDIIAIAWRSKNHTDVPKALSVALAWRSEGEINSARHSIRIGVFHIANEKIRYDWPWYVYPDFVIRNYWLPATPLHTRYVPLGHQMPEGCIPRLSGDLERTDVSEKMCTCTSEPGLKRASERKFLWTFSGSVRKHRGELLKVLRKDTVIGDMGTILVSRKFGGDGVVGSNGPDNPKTIYLASIRESRFVFAPCGNVMETHRIYEALALGAIPVIENCEPDMSDFFPFKKLVVDGGPSAMVQFVRQHAQNTEAVDELQKEVMLWWRGYSNNIPRDVFNTITNNLPRSAIIPP